MVRVRDGQVETLAELYSRHRTRLFNFFVRLTGNTHLSEDLVQEVFLRMLKYRHTFKPESRFTTWMYQIARNAHHDAWRKARHETAADDDESNDAQPLWTSQSAPDWEAERNQDVAILQEALAALPLESREVLMLTRFQDLKYEEVARVLECSVSAVKMRVFRAMQELRQSFRRLAGKEAV